MIIWGLTALALMLNFAARGMIHRRARRSDPDPDLRVQPSTAFFDGRPAYPTLRAGWRQAFEESDDPRIEHARRSELAAWVAFFVWIFVGLAISLPVEGLIRRELTVGLGQAITPIVIYVIGLLWLFAFVDAIAGPDRRWRTAGISLLGMVAATLAMILQSD
jgi:hypothetical protein